MQDNVGGDLLAPRLIPAPCPQTLEELHIPHSGESFVRRLHRVEGVICGGDARSFGRGSMLGEGYGFVGFSEAYVSAGTGSNLLFVAEVPD